MQHVRIPAKRNCGGEPLRVPGIVSQRGGARSAGSRGHGLRGCRVAPLPQGARMTAASNDARTLAALASGRTVGFHHHVVVRPPGTTHEITWGVYDRRERADRGSRGGRGHRGVRGPGDRGRQRLAALPATSKRPSRTTARSASAPDDEPVVIRMPFAVACELGTCQPRGHPRESAAEEDFFCWSLPSTPSAWSRPLPLSEMA